MKILITNWSLAERTGTELVVYELAREMRRRGHQVAAYSSRLGELAELIRGASIPVVHDPLDCPFRPDVIHGQHHLDAMTALLAFPGVPVVYHVHGGRAWLEKPPQHPQIRHYVAMCAILADTICVELGLNDETLSVVPNWIDGDRFRQPAKSHGRTGKALLFGGGLSNADTLRRLAPAFDAHGISLESAGDWSTKDKGQPEVALPRYDIVMATGRSALEAMASGCAVLMANDKSNAGWVLPESFDENRKGNFSPRHADSAYDANLVKSQLDGYASAFNSGAFAQVTERVHNECHLGLAVDVLLAIYEKVTAEMKLDGADSPALESFQKDRLAVHTYLRHLSPAVMQVETLNHTHQMLQEKVAKLEKINQKQQDKIAKLEGQVSAADKDQKRFKIMRKHWLGRLAYLFTRERES